jgi:hypothetical protein
VNTFEAIDRGRLRFAPADFGGETTDARLARRQRNWIATVKFV